ncbi:MAG: lipase family protein [Sinimarinibacterium sp.]|jgi:pimeloyl-ACP methyl ester carboxylesterase
MLINGSPPWRAAAAAILIVLAGCSASDNDAQSNRPVDPDAALFAPTPDADDFYRAPEGLQGAPGTVIKFREITYQPAGAVLPNSAWQLQYLTTDVQGRVIAATATVVKPVGPSAYGDPVLLSFQHAYDSLGAQCTPSHTATGSSANTTNMAETLEYLPALQTLGWTLLIPDYEGPDHAFGAGRLSGQATLDAIRAALGFEPLGLSASTPVGLWGYSGGAYATTWAAAMQAQSAPEINLVGVVAGGTPVNLLEVIPGAENTDSFSLLLGLLFGVARAYPEFLPADLLNEEGRRALAALRDSCEGKPTDGSAAPNGQLADYVNADAPYNTAGFLSVGPRLDLLRSEMHPASDVFLYHEIDDELVPIAGADALADRWCQAGTPLSYYRSTAASAGGATPVGTHTSGAALGTPNAIAYLDSRFSGLGAPATPVGTTRCN